MNSSFSAIFAGFTVMLVMFVLIVMVFSRYTKVGPNQVLIISGRKRQLDDGTLLGFRIVKGGGTFVYPVLEKADVLSLNPVTIVLPRLKTRAMEGGAVGVNCQTQIKINSDDASIVRAAEFFLGKNPLEIQGIVTPILERQVVEVLGKSSAESIVQNPAACAAQVQTAAAGELVRMGLSVLSVSFRDVSGG